MKTRVVGIGILLVVIVSAVIYSFVSTEKESKEISGYVGGEKIGLLEDEQVQNILNNKYGLSIDYSKAGSIDMVTADFTGRNFLFPSSQTALEIYEQTYGKPVKSEIIFNTPIVLYTRKEVAKAFIAKGMITEKDGVYYIDMLKLTECIESGKKWSDIGLDKLYGNIIVGTTDPTKSNSGNMFAGLLANTLCGGTADESNIDSVLPRLKNIFQKLGYMETSSSDLFDQFLKTGMGAKPLIAGYENQILEFASQNTDIWNQIKDDIVVLYPTPTVWASHVFIALDDDGKTAIDALLDPEIQEISWEKHGFRTGAYGTQSDTALFGVDGLAKEINSVAPMPDAKVMDKIINALS